MHETVHPSNLHVALESISKEDNVSMGDPTMDQHSSFDRWTGLSTDHDDSKTENTFQQQNVQASLKMRLVIDDILSDLHTAHEDELGKNKRIIVSQADEMETWRRESAVSTEIIKNRDTVIESLTLENTDLNTRLEVANRTIDDSQLRASNEKEKIEQVEKRYEALREDYQTMEMAYLCNLKVLVKRDEDMAQLQRKLKDCEEKYQTIESVSDGFVAHNESQSGSHPSDSTSSNSDKSGTVRGHFKDMTRSSKSTQTVRRMHVHWPVPVKQKELQSSPRQSDRLNHHLEAAKYESSYYKRYCGLVMTWRYRRELLGLHERYFHFDPRSYWLGGVSVHQTSSEADCEKISFGSKEGVDSLAKIYSGLLSGEYQFVLEWFLDVKYTIKTHWSDESKGGQELRAALLRIEDGFADVVSDWNSEEGEEDAGDSTKSSKRPVSPSGNSRDSIKRQRTS